MTSKTHQQLQHMSVMLREDAVVLDLRPKSKFQVAHVAGAVHINTSLKSQKEQKLEEPIRERRSSHSALVRTASGLLSPTGLLSSTGLSEIGRQSEIAKQSEIGRQNTSITNASDAEVRALTKRIFRKLRTKVAAAYPPSVMIFVYCEDGKKSKIAKMLLEVLGYRNVTEIGGAEDKHSPIYSVIKGSVKMPGLDVCYCCCCPQDRKP